MILAEAMLNQFQALLKQFESNLKQAQALLKWFQAIPKQLKAMLILAEALGKQMGVITASMVVAVIGFELNSTLD